MTSIEQETSEEFQPCEEVTTLFYLGQKVAEFQCSLDKAHADPEIDDVYEGSMPLHTAYHEETGEFLAEWSTGTDFHATFTSEGGQVGHVVESTPEEPEGQPEA